MFRINKDYKVRFDRDITVSYFDAPTFELSFDTLATSPDLIAARATWFQTDTIFDTIYRSTMLEELRD